MDRYTVAASAVLDYLWDDPAFRAHFHAQGYELRDLARLVDAVFRPAYLRFCKRLSPEEMNVIRRGVIEALMPELVSNPGFKEAWRAWDRKYQEEFLAEQSERPFALRLMHLYADEAGQVYREAFDAHVNAKGS